MLYLALLFWFCDFGLVVGLSTLCVTMVFRVTCLCLGLWLLA